MPKEIRNPKSDRCSAPDGPERDNSAFWEWAGEPDSEAMVLREGPTSDGMPHKDLMERTAQFGEAIVRFVKKVPRAESSREQLARRPTRRRRHEHWSELLRGRRFGFGQGFQEEH